MSGVFSSYMGSRHDSIFGGCDLWKLAERKTGINTGPDALPAGCTGHNAHEASPGHNGGSNYGMADTSAKRRKTQVIRSSMSVAMILCLG